MVRLERARDPRRVHGSSLRARGLRLRLRPLRRLRAHMPHDHQRGALLSGLKHA